MAGVAAAIAAKLGELNGVEDLSAVADPAELNAPAVLVTPGAIRPGVTLDGSGEVELRLDLVSRDLAWLDATAALDEMLAKIEPLGFIIVGDVLPISLVMPGSSGASLPAWRVTILTEYTTTED